MRIAAAVITGSICWGAAHEAAAICRVVEDPDSPPPIVQPAQSVLVIKRSDVVVGEDCAPPDAGPTDAGAVDGGIPDAGAVDAGAVCDEVRGDAVTMVVQPRFTIGDDGSSFALLMVTPAPPVVALERKSLFKELAIATAPAVWVEPTYVEDPALGYQCSDPKWNAGSAGGCATSEGYWSYDDDEWTPPDPDDPDVEDPDDAVQLETIGAYQIAKLQLADVDELAVWLADNGYMVTSDDLDAARPYVEMGWTVLAVRVATDAAHVGGLEPLAMTYAGSELRLPLGISTQPPPAEAALTVYVQADGRYDFPGAEIPYAQFGGMGGGGFLTRNNLWVDLSNGAEEDPIATHRTGDPEYRDIVTVDQTIRIPSSDCPPPPRSPRNSSDDDWGCACRTGTTPSPGLVILLGLTLLGLARLRR